MMLSIVAVAAIVEPPAGVRGSTTGSFPLLIICSSRNIRAFRQKQGVTCRAAGNLCPDLVARQQLCHRRQNWPALKRGANRVARHRSKLHRNDALFLTRETGTSQ